jgi:hypothetical protein
VTSPGEAMSDQTPRLGPSDLCRSCGLCCNGTLFGRVRLLPEDDPEPLRLAGIPITSDDTGSQFALACAAHQGCCQVYDSRPSNCRTYQCKLLRRFGRGVVSWAEATVQVDRLRRLREHLAVEIERLRPGMGRASVAEISKVIPPFDELAADIELHKLWAPVLLRLVALKRFAKDNFHASRKAGAADVTPGDRKVSS